jgi:hypothetical protein
MMKRCARLLAVLLGAILVVAACGTTASPAPAATTASSGGPASQVAPASASPSRAASPSAASPSASAAVAAPCTKISKAFDPKKVDLTGPWSGDDGGIYYLRQVGSVVWWNGMSGQAESPSGLGRDWNNVGRGVIKALKIDVEWADVPRGGILGDGTLSLTIKDDGSGNVQIVKDSETGSGFGNTIWTPCTPG